MKITITLFAGNDNHTPTKKDLDKNIEALQRAIDGKPLANDFVPLMDTKSILEGIKGQLHR